MSGQFVVLKNCVSLEFLDTIELADTYETLQMLQCNITYLIFHRTWCVIADCELHIKDMALFEPIWPFYRKDTVKTPYKLMN